MKGKVKFYNTGKGFGFISADDGKDYFVHISGLADGVQLRDGDAVVFEVGEGDRGPKAVNVQLDKGGSSEESQEESDEDSE